MTFSVASLKTWIDLISGLLTMIGGLLAALWAYSKYIVERGLIPPTQLSVECVPLGLQQAVTVLEVIVSLKNCGASTLIAGNIRLDVRTIDAADKAVLFTDPTHSGFGRLIFPKSLRSELDKAPGQHQRGLLLVPHNTFVQAGVEQPYSFTTAIPNSTTYVLVWASFQYAQHPSPFQRIILWFSRRLGLLQWSLTHITEPHTIERVFCVATSTPSDAP